MKYNKQHLKYGSYEEIIASFNDPINGRALSCAHRSYWRMYPENSVPAILAAIDYGCDIVELDVRATKDGVCVLSHDRNLGRCTNATGELAKMNVDEIEYDKIKDLRLKFATGGSSAMTSDEVICRFDDCIKLCEGKIMINLDKVMENKVLREHVYDCMLDMTKKGYHPFEFCMFKLFRESAEEIVAWINEKKEKDGVDIIYVPWGVAGCEALEKYGYHAPQYEDGFNYTNNMIERKTRGKYGYFANTFEGSGWDDPEHWTYLLDAGANVIHTDEGDLCPKIIRKYYGERYTIEFGNLIRYSGPADDMVLPDEVVTIKRGAYENHEDLESMVLPTGVCKVEAGAFVNCPKLKLIVVYNPDCVIEDGAFDSNPVLWVKDGAKVASAYECKTLDCGDYDFEIRRSKVSINKYLGNDTEITVPSTMVGLPVNQIGRNCYEGTPITKVTLMDNTDMIEQEAFKGCDKLLTVEFCKPIKSISVTAFDDCSRYLTFACADESYPCRYARAKGIRTDCPEYGEPIPSPFAGSGSVEDPYLLTSVQDIDKLVEIMETDKSMHYASSCYALTNDIYFDTAQENNFTPIGRPGNVFRGEIDGGGHTIHGMRRNMEERCVSFIGNAVRARIANVNTDDTKITGLGVIGGVVARASYCEIENCHATNFDLEGIGNFDVCVGGCVAKTDGGFVKRCSAVLGSIKGMRDLGGFSGELASTLVEECFCDKIGDLMATSNSNGGFVGNFKGSTVIRNCYTTVNVEGALRIGAFSGYTYGSRFARIENCFATGTPSSITTTNHGGFLGAHMGAVSNCYYRADIENVDVNVGNAITLEEFASDELVNKLGDAFVMGEGHPVLKCFK